jgi:NAD(P)-dependent dehydrogenase (short-subunit alcohol dehydrogenase family)
MLEGKKIVITGAARGLGAEIAKGCIAAGAHVIIGDILENEGRKTATLLGENTCFYPLDLANRDSIQAFAAQCGVVDGLVNNGAIATNVGGIGFEDIDPALFARVLNVNVLGLWEITRALTPNMHGGAIVNIASDTALWGALLCGK